MQAKGCEFDSHQFHHTCSVNSTGRVPALQAGSERLLEVRVLYRVPKISTWCNGSTTVSKTACSGSSPDVGATYAGIVQWKYTTLPRSRCEFNSRYLLQYSRKDAGFQTRLIISVTWVQFPFLPPICRISVMAA